MATGARSAAREAALQMLYAAELGRHDVDRLINDFWREFPGDAAGRSYADGAVRGVLAQRERIDEHVVRASQNWRLERMTPIARNVLRLGTWELLEQREIPRAVIIDESVEVAKRYGGSESSAFVNGVLDRIADFCGRQDEPRSPKPRSAAPAASGAPQGAPTKLADDTSGDDRPLGELAGPPPSGAIALDEDDDDEL